ncbi:hypothetical protein ISF_01156 [Cordyceps fumosorosea ARSEF 2679]|uniref:Uncharacterized protein n=1 Tax=Cordyceps fumosorosea (strain ARSEF 2679) TaxID=1081104 RepID=A0A168EUT5_CORFA|nr:hypothetical protein ISF_01156 [Cordyceps fumosorosea ARSEF 2679]OAA74255.1 hypothetical protein ISF_01156 [Cordyceps fumosorosea ARSEF 2679]
MCSTTLPQTKKCTEIVIDDHNKHNELSAYTHCTAVVACCTFQIAESGNKNWGDIINENVCIYKGNLLGNGA